MPDFNIFRMDEQLIGRLYVIRKNDSYLDSVITTNPKYNKDILVRTVETESYEKYEDWKRYIHNASKRILLKININNNIKEYESTEVKHIKS